MNQVIIAYDVLVEGGDITLDSTELVDYKIVKAKDVRSWPSNKGPTKPSRDNQRRTTVQKKISPHKKGAYC